MASITPQQLDAALALGWRHFGTRFFRYSHAVHEGRLCRVLPLRIRLADFSETKSQRRLLRRNADLQIRIQPAQLDAERHALFAKHRERFRTDAPDSLLDFLDPQPASVPCRCVEVGVYRAGRLIAASFLDLGERAASSVYAIFDPAESRRSLGNFTMLLEIAHARLRSMACYYSGYSYDVPSPYDYKKQFNALEFYDWTGHWLPWPAP